MNQHTTDLKYQIERILLWEPSSHWRSQDFVRLSEHVFTYTQRQVDAQHLEAFWRTSAIKSPDLLDTLARFVDYIDWDDFCVRNFYGVVEVDEETQLTHPPMWEIPMRWVIIICWFSVIVSIAVAILLVWKR
ncbi:hypothetical protein G8759_01390 [Spirosoma aureum]|uniref:Uncharacterized protein n=1 Tax=Spirosoma aureum TaxID=2692134 RepID=A0A6G9AGR9_9BACT|nr:hypothetical protein [Spirosoma aureum]QIP11383.1 hypothetical protein G8759_01390 [Spirosoma aureum]